MNYIFDLDGTLIDSLPGIAWSVDAALAACRLPRRTRDLAPLIGPPIRNILSEVSGIDDPDVLDRLEGSFRASYDAEGWQLTSCFRGVPDRLWGLLTGGADLWVATNKPSSPAGKILRKLGLASFFREVACRDSRKPPFGSKAEVLIDLVERHSLPPDACLMVGDTLEDSRAAQAAGIACTLVEAGLLETVTI